MHRALAVSLAAVALAIVAVAAQGPTCTGEYEVCGGGDCVLDASLCGKCGAGQYLCPDTVSCVNGAAGYIDCPNVKGTFFDWTLSHEQRLDALIAAATAAEKIAQLTNDAPAIVRLGIPSYNWLNDDEHGVMGTHATVFPDGCGLGATWSTATLQQVGLAIGMEARGGHNGDVHMGNRGHGQNGKGITLYSPNLNLVRDPRWGRAQEVYSEDPHLTAALTYALVTGAQNMDGPFMLSGMCCKHFAAYDIESIPVQRYNFSADVDARNLWETYLPAFRACVAGAQAMHVMCSYNAINMVPTCAEPRLLNGILREQWGWDGYVVSDYDAWAQIKDTHDYCGDYVCAAAKGINAGLDQEGGGTAVIQQMATAIARGTVTNTTVDEAFRRLFRARLRLGMHDPPTLVPWNTVGNDSATVESAQHLALARLAAQEAMTLLQNTGNVLPLPSATPLRIALIGPQHPMEDLLLGNYDQYPDLGVASILEGVVRAVGQNETAACKYEQNTALKGTALVGPLATFGPEQCCFVCSTNPACVGWTWQSGNCYQFSSTGAATNTPGAVSGTCNNANSLVQWQSGCDSIECANTNGFAAAATLASNSDVVIVTLGLDQSLESEGHDRSTIALPPNQYALVKAMRAATGAPIIVVLVHGGTLELAEVLGSADAVLDAWYPGQMGGYAVADVLFGAFNPAGRVTVTYYQSDSDLPAAGQMDPYPIPGQSQGLTYRFFTGKPQFPFGFGLSYTTFSYSSLAFNGSSFAPCDHIGVRVTVTNTGRVTGDEVVQVYVAQPSASVPVPTVRLAAFKRVKSVAPGASVTVNLAIAPEWHSAVWESGNNIYDGAQVMVESGPLTVWVGGGQPNTPFTVPAPLSGSVTVSAASPLDQC